MQDQQTRRARDFDHARVAQEFGQIAPRGAGRGFGRTAEVDQQERRAGALAVAVRRFGPEAHRVFVPSSVRQGLLQGLADGLQVHGR